MSRVQSNRKVVAATVGDLHLRHDKPSCRAEDDWYAVMRRHLWSLDKILENHGRPPLLYTGDIFHKWNSPPELVNFAIRHLPHGYSIAGNHDLPFHQYKDIKKSAYWTLVEAGKITNLKPNQQLMLGKFKVTAFPYGTDPVNPDVKTTCPHVALIHRYCWKDGHSHPGAKPEDFVDAYCDTLDGFDGLVFGDNHQAFCYAAPRTPGRLGWVRNGGCFVRQTVTEMDVRPSVGLIYDDGSLTEVGLDCREDKFHAAEETPAGLDDEEMAKLIESLNRVNSRPQDFRASVLRALDQSDVSAGVRRVVLEFLGEGR